MFHENDQLKLAIAKERYGPRQVPIEEDKEELIETKASLNNMFHENDQLKLAIAKERYGPRQVPIEAKVKLNILQTENEELKTEVRKFR